ncbi:polysaccharide biosynthesis C-terminal domain-containing protein [Clostridium sp. UBA4395]|uniref:oligosaccharide flippase family protein n=1 Tax=Clostridium sp. UBA4395 TaxID=1946360 RepID=UPI003217EAB8
MNIAKDSFYMMLGKSFKTFGSLVFTMIISRIFSMNDLGTYKQILMISTLIFTLIPLGIPTSISYYYSNLDNLKKSKLITNSNFFMLIVGIIVSVFLFLFKNILSDWLNNKFLYSNIIGLIFYSYSLIISSNIENSYISSGHSSYIGRINVIYYTIYYVLCGIFILKTNNINCLFILMGILEFIRSICLFYKFYKINKLKFITDFKFFYHQFLFCIPLGLSTIIQTINIELDKLFISYNYTPTQLAIYSNGAMSIPFVSLISISVASVILPILAKKYKNEGFKAVLDIWGNSTLVVFSLLSIVYFSIVYYSNGYISFIFSEKYISSLPIFIIYLIKVPLSCTVFGNILIVIGKRKLTLYNMILALLLNCVLNYIFIKCIGFNGPAISSVLIHIILIYLQLKQISKSTGYKISNLLPFKRMGIQLFITFIISLLFYNISKLFNLNSVLNLFIFGGLNAIFSLIIILYINKKLIIKLEGVIK